MSCNLKQAGLHIAATWPALSAQTDMRSAEDACQRENNPRVKGRNMTHRAYRRVSAFCVDASDFASRRHLCWALML